MTSAFFALASAAAGFVQATRLCRSAAARAGAASVFARVLLVGLVLVLAARAGCLAWGFAGWIAGYVPGCGLACRRIR